MNIRSVMPALFLHAMRRATMSGNRNWSADSMN